MQLPPLLFADVSLLFAVGTIALLITAEFSSSYYGHSNLVIDRQKIKNAAYVTALIFLITVVITIINILSA